MDWTVDGLRAMPDDDFDMLDHAVSFERNRRRTVREAPERADRVAGEYQRALGRKPGDQWVMPTGPLSVYGLDDETRHREKEWRSRIHANATEPGDPADPQNYRWWENLTDVIPEGQFDPFGYDYEVGDTFSDGGVDYVVIQAHTSQPDWIPAAEPSLYEVVPEPEPEPEDPPAEDEPEPEPQVPEFKQPTAEKPYNKGDLVRFDGQIYESTIDGNVWSPAGYPAGWELQPA